MALTPKYYPINEKDAGYAWSMAHMSDYKKDKETDAYKYYVDEMYKHASEAIEKSPEDAEQIAKIADRYAYKLAENINERIRIDMMAPSVMISGLANFPVRKKERQISRWHDNMEEWNEIQKLKDKIDSIVAGRNIIMSGDTNAVDKLQKKINEAKAGHERMVKINAYYRKNKTAKGCPELTDEEAEDIDDAMRKNVHSWITVPFQSYELQTSNANIKRLEERLHELTKAKAIGKKEYDAGDFKIVENTDLMRLQLLFNDKPDYDTRTKLKKYGFRWSPTNSAWQRDLNTNGRYALNGFIKENGISTEWNYKVSENFSKEASTKADDPSKDIELAPVKMTKDTEKVGFKQGKYVRPMKTPNGLLAVAGQGLYKDYTLQDGSTIRLWVHNTDDNIDEETRTVTSNHPRQWIITEDSTGTLVKPDDLGFISYYAGTPAIADYYIRYARNKGKLDELANKIKQGEDFNKHLKLVADYKEKRNIPTIHLNKELNNNIQDKGDLVTFSYHAESDEKTAEKPVKSEPKTDYKKQVQEYAEKAIRNGIENLNKTNHSFDERTQKFIDETAKAMTDPPVDDYDRGFSNGDMQGAVEAFTLQYGGNDSEIMEAIRDKVDKISGHVQPKIVRDPEAEAKYKQMFKDYWDGKIDVKTLYAYQTQLLKENKIDPKINDSIQLQASNEYNEEKAKRIEKERELRTAKEAPRAPVAGEHIRLHTTPFDNEEFIVDSYDGFTLHLKPANNPTETVSNSIIGFLERDFDKIEHLDKPKEPESKSVASETSVNTVTETPKAPKPAVTSTVPTLAAKKKNQQISWKQGALKDKKKNKLNALWVIAEKTNGKWHGEYSLFPPEGREKETGKPFSSKNTIDFDGGSVPEDMSFLLSSWSISLEDSKPKYKRMSLPTNKQLTNNAFKGR